MRIILSTLLNCYKYWSMYRDREMYKYMCLEESSARINTNTLVVLIFARLTQAVLVCFTFLNFLILLHWILITHVTIKSFKTKHQGLFQFGTTIINLSDFYDIIYPVKEKRKKYVFFSRKTIPSGKGKLHNCSWNKSSRDRLT